MSRPFVFETVLDLRTGVAAARGQGKRIGFVPTMGALHEGHASLIRTARQESDYVVVSIFVNPTQFGPNEDFARYPRTFQADAAICRDAGADVIFHPNAETIYPPGFATLVEVEGLQDVLCGASRPGHFRGVCTVVAKLFHIVRPDVAFFGQKDAQQAIILTRMVSDLEMPVEMRILPTVRDRDGLALSSRNRYLTPAQRENAPAIYQSLLQTQEQILAGERDTNRLQSKLRSALERIPEATVDYAEIVSSASLRRSEIIAGQVLVAVAVRLGTTRLIDNLMVDVPGG